MSYEKQILLLQNLTYEPEFGVFRWKKSPAQSVPSGGVAGRMSSSGYVQIPFKRNYFVAHRLAWLWVYGVEPAGQIDHVNGNRSDNRISNLRDVSQSMNQQNCKLRKDNKSGKKGVTWHPSSCKWQAAISVNGRSKYLGVFQDVEEASQAYLLAAKQFHQINSVFNEGRL